MHERERARGNLYEETAPAAVYPALQGALSVPVAVVGGGYTGLSTALHLAEAGTEALVLEAEAPGWGASGRNGGHLNPGLKPDPDTLLELLGQEQGEALVAFVYGVTDFTAGLIRRLGLDCELRQNGTLRVAVHAKAAAAVAVTAEQCRRRGMPVRLLDAAEVAAMTGTSRYRVALLDTRGGDLNPLKYARGLATAAAAAGARIHGQSRVLSLRRESGGWLLKTAGGEVRAGRVLVATNGYSDELVPGLRRSLVPVFSSIVATQPLPPALAETVMRSRAVLYEMGNITVYYRVDGQNRLIIGGRGPMRPLSEPALLANLTRYAERLWPALKGIAWTHAWNGRVAITKDDLPHLHQPEAGLLACVGYNGRGVALSTAMGQALARHLTEGAPLPLPPTPIQPFAFHRFWPLGVKAAILKGRLKDALGR